MASRGLRQSFFQPAGRLCALAALVVSNACSDDSGGNNANEPDAAPAPVCGNGVLEEGEECDKGAENSDLEPNACRSDCRLARCGDGVADDGEDCDGADLAGKSCPDLPDPEAPSGEHFTGGSLACTSDCTLDTSGCTRCGDGLAEGEEACDGSDLRGATCATAAGKEDGRLWCTSDCTLNTSECHTCGDGVLEPGEDCELGLDLNETCEGLGYTFGTLACDLATCRYDTTDCHSVCGNGKAETGEQCDGADLGGQDCASVGLVSGELACSPACLLDVSGCSKCGDGILDADRGEECDGTDLGGRTCQDLTGMGGTLACTADCHLDVSGCEAPATCGNGLLDVGEQCDGGNLNGQTCESLNPQVWGGGSLACTQSCTFDTSGCEPLEHCGNGLAESDFGEECDGTDLGGRTCQSEGFAGGNLACNGDCTLDTSGCESAATCGNGTAEGSEQCDGSDLRGKTCQDLNYYAGTLSCTAQCTYDTSGCTTCGDGEVNGPNEQCDGSDLNQKTCEDLGYYGGSLACRDNCTFDLSDCRAHGFCGDGQANGPEDCDGNDLQNATCESLGHLAGTLACKADCTFDESGCSDCGNGRIDPGEQCDGSNLNGQTCQTLGYDPSGTLSCTDYCTFDVSRCGGTATCGNGIKESGEFCDGADLGGKTCQSLGYYGGQLRCRADCSGLDTSDCQAYGFCGDGVWQQAYEACDPADRGPAVCQAAGHAGGTVTCSADCTQVTSWNCNECGNGVIDQGEECDGDNVNGQTCQDQGFPGGNLTCTPDCRIDTGTCWQCGNGQIDPGEECDGDNLNGKTCQDLGYLHGELACTADCHLDDSNCDSCGDGIIQPNEVCDDGNDMDWDGCTQCRYRELLVSSPKEGSENVPRIDMAPDGRFVVVWFRYRYYGRYDSTYLQRFHADGTKDGTEWLSPNPDEGVYSRVALWPDGRMGLARSVQGDWVEVSAVTWDLQVLWQETFRYDYPRTPSLVPLPGHHLAAFWSNGCSGSTHQMQVFVLDESGNTLQSWYEPAESGSQELHTEMIGDATALYTGHPPAPATLRLSRWTTDGSEFWHLDLNASAGASYPYNRRRASLAQGPDEGVWILYRDETDQLVLKQFAPDGTETASRFVANSIQRGAYKVDSGSDGRAVVVWEDPAHHIFARIFGPDGSPWSSVIQVSDKETVPDIYHERQPDVAVHPTENYFVVVYSMDTGLNWGDNIVPQSIVMRGFAADGSPLGPPPW